MDNGRSRQTKKVNIFNQEKRRVLCITNEYDCLGDGSMIHKEELQVGKQYTFVKGEAKCYGFMVYLDELPCKYGYHSEHFEELQPYDAKIFEREYHNLVDQMLVEGEMKVKQMLDEGKITEDCYTLEEFKALLRARKN